MLAFDLTLQGTSQDHGETLSGNSRLWLEQIAGPMVPLPMDSAYLGMEYAGLDKQALVRVHALNREMDEIQTQALMGALSGNGEQDMEQQMMRIQTLLAEMTQVAAEQLLHPGDSELALQMLVDHQGERQLTLDSKARYLGLDGNNLSTQELMALSETEIQQMLDITVRVDMHDSLVPPPYAGRLTALAEQGVVDRQGERWRGVINANGGRLVDRCVVRHGYYGCAECFLSLAKPQGTLPQFIVVRPEQLVLTTKGAAQEYRLRTLS